MTEKDYIDAESIYKESMINWLEVWDSSLTIAENTQQLIAKTVFLPCPDLMLPIVTAYALTPTRWSRCLPILTCWGQKGSGKSTIALISGIIRGVRQTFSATDTFAGLRNALDYMRWEDESREREKEGSILLWDNIHIETLLRDEKIYQLLLFGYSRNTERVSIAIPGGGNREFRTFSPKIVATVDDIHTFPKFEELQRRLLVIPHKPFDLMTDKDKRGACVFDKLDIDSIYWNGIEDNFHSIWNDRENCVAFAKRRVTTNNLGKGSEMNSSEWTITLDLIVTGVVCGVWQTTKEAIQHFDRYWNYARYNIFDSTTATTQHIQSFIKEETSSVESLNAVLNGNNQPLLPVIVSPAKLKNKLGFHHQRGELDIVPQPRDIGQIMGALGWKLTREGWVKRQ